MRMEKYCLAIILILLSPTTVLLPTCSCYFKSIAKLDHTFLMPKNCPSNFPLTKRHFLHLSLSKIEKCSDDSESLCDSSRYFCRICSYYHSAWHNLYARNYDMIEFTSTTKTDCKKEKDGLMVAHSQTAWTSTDGLCLHDLRDDKGREPLKRATYFTVEDGSTVLLPDVGLKNENCRIDSTGSIMVFAQGGDLLVFKRTKGSPAEIEQMLRSRSKVMQIFTSETANKLKTVAIVTTSLAMMYAANSSISKR